MDLWNNEIKPKRHKKSALTIQQLNLELFKKPRKKIIFKV